MIWERLPVCTRATLFLFRSIPSECCATKERTMLDQSESGIAAEITNSNGLQKTNNLILLKIVPIPSRLDGQGRAERVRLDG